MGGRNARTNLSAAALSGISPLAVTGGLLSSARGDGFASGAANPLEGILGRESARRRQAEQQSQLESAFNSVPEFQSITDQNGNLLRGFSSLESSPALRALQRSANAGGVTNTGRLQLEQNQLEGRQALQNIQAAGQGSLQSGFSALASRGGLRSGTRERLVANQANQNITNRQNQRFLNNQQRLGILANDGDRQNRLLGTVAQAELGDRGLRIQDIRNSNEDAIERAAALLESRLNSQNAPQGGLGGFLSGLLGG